MVSGSSFLAWWLGKATSADFGTAGVEVFVRRAKSEPPEGTTVTDFRRRHQVGYLTLGGRRLQSPANRQSLGSSSPHPCNQSKALSYVIASCRVQDCRGCGVSVWLLKCTTLSEQSDDNSGGSPCVCRARGSCGTVTARTEELRAVREGHDKGVMALQPPIGYGVVLRRG
jgi:hypothetical protein